MKDFFTKNIKPFLGTAAVAVVVVIAWPYIKPYLQKLPVLGDFVK